MADIGTGMTGLAGRYALALLDIADEKKQLDAVASDLQGLKRAFEESSELREMVRSPLYTRPQKTAAMTAIMDKLGAANLARRFVLVVA